MKKKLYLSRTNKVLAGVCGGIADYLNVDATLLRIIWVILTIMTNIFPLIALYVVCWALMPLSD